MGTSRCMCVHSYLCAWPSLHGSSRTGRVHAHTHAPHTHARTHPPTHPSSSGLPASMPTLFQTGVATPNRPAVSGFLGFFGVKEYANREDLCMFSHSKPSFANGSGFLCAKSTCFRGHSPCDGPLLPTRIFCVHLSGVHFRRAQTRPHASTPQLAATRTPGTRTRTNTHTRHTPCPHQYAGVYTHTQTCTNTQTHTHTHAPTHTAHTVKLPDGTSALEKIKAKNAERSKAGSVNDRAQTTGNIMSENQRVCARCFFHVFSGCVF